MTLQIAEKLTYNGEEYALHTEPLRSYLYKHPIENPKPTRTFFSTACWRGYVGHWAIEEAKLYLIELDSFEEIPIRNILNDLFPNQEKVLADWFSGTISTTLDDMYMYLEFKFEKGRLVNVEKKESKYKGEYVKILD